MLPQTTTAATATVEGASRLRLAGQLQNVGFVAASVYTLLLLLALVSGSQPLRWFLILALAPLVACFIVSERLSNH